MNAMIWKELRENFRWAVLGCLVLTLAEFYMLAQEKRDFQNGTSGDITLTDPTFLMVVLFGSALVALGLGAVQILPERSRDRWAALLHRPVSRGVIFSGKVCAGLLLYGAAVTLPFLASACYVAWPGKFPAPFVPALMLPGFHALAGGIACYFGSLLLCLHRGRWLGTRGVLLLAVGMVFLLQLASQGRFLLWPMLSAGILGLAAWGTMLGGESVAGWPALGYTAFVAVVMLGAQSGFWLLNLGLGLLPKPGGAQSTVYTRLEATTDGAVLKITSSLEGGDTKVTDLAGKTITDERYTGNNSYQNFCQTWPLGYQINAPRRGYFFLEGSTLRGAYYVQAIRLGNYAKESWYLLVGQNYFIGYDNLSCRCIGICDREGFKPAGAMPVPFDGPLNGEQLFQEGKTWFWDGSKLYTASFLDRRVTPFFDLVDSSLAAMVPIPAGRNYEKFPYVVLALKDGIRVLDENGKLLFARPYLHDPRIWTSISVGTNPSLDRIYLESRAGYFDVQTIGAPATVHLDELDLRGELLRNFSQTTGATGPNKPFWLTVASACSLPIVPASLLKLYRRSVPPSISHEPFPSEQDASAISHLGWIFLTLFALGLAAITLLWARQVGFTPQKGRLWAALVFAFGPAGLLAFRLASRWPEQLRCPFCKHFRSISQNECPHCQHPWAASPPTGTEILQPLAT